jgi:FdhD protein
VSRVERGRSRVAVRYVQRTGGDPASDQTDRIPAKAGDRSEPSGDETAAGSRRAFNIRPTLDELPEEQAVTIEINGRPIAVLLCTPNGLAELAAGWVFAQGFVHHPEQLRSVTPRADRVSVMIDKPERGGQTWTSLLGAGFDARHLLTPDREGIGLRPLGRGDGDDRAWTIGRDRFLLAIDHVFARFRDERGSGGVHHAAVADGDLTCAVARDVSRHNAVDKAIGWALLRRLPRSGLMLCLSGRVSADIVFKAWRAEIPLIASRALPTAEAVELAHQAGIAVVGRVLDGRRAIYTHPWRLRQEEGFS